MVVLHRTKNIDQRGYNCASNLPKGRMFEVCSCHCSKPTKVGVQWAMMVIIAERFHLFPFRTQKLSSHTSTIFGWRRPEKIDRCHQPASQLVLWLVAIFLLNRKIALADYCDALWRNTLQRFSFITSFPTIGFFIRSVDSTSKI